MQRFRAYNKTTESSKGSIPLPPGLAMFWSGIWCSGCPSILFHSGWSATTLTRARAHAETHTLCLFPQRGGATSSGRTSSKSKRSAKRLPSASSQVKKCLGPSSLLDFLMMSGANTFFPPSPYIFKRKRDKGLKKSPPSLWSTFLILMSGPRNSNN